MSLKQFLMAGTAALMVIGAATGCKDTTQADKKPVVVCHPPAGYKKAGLAGRTAPGIFYVCVNYGKTCIVTMHFPDSGDSADIQQKQFMTSSGSVTIPRNAKSWGRKDCGTVYRKS